MKQSDLRRVYSPVPQAFHDALVVAAHNVKEEQAVTKRMSWIFAVVLAVVLIASTALALVNYYSVRQYAAGGNPSPTFEAHLVEVNQTYENDYIIFTLTDAIFDGNALAIAMTLEAKDPEKYVYLCPKITAMSGEHVLALDIIGMRGDFMSGFVFPSLIENYLDGKYGVDVALYEDEAEGDVTWTLQMGVFVLNWPVKNAPEYAGLGADSPEYKAYTQNFRAAYDRQEILVTWGDSPVEYAWLGQPTPDGMSEEAFSALPLDEKLVRSGAFTKVDSIEYSFSTRLPDEEAFGFLSPTE